MVLGRAGGAGSKLQEGFGQRQGKEGSELDKALIEGCIQCYRER